MDARFLAIISSMYLALVAVRSDAYSVETHKILSRAAARTSVTLGAQGSGAVYTDIALRPEAKYPDNTLRLRSIVDLIGFGAIQEDEIPLLRMRNHFFDPQNNGRPLTLGVELGFPSPDWILEDRGPLPERFPKMLPQDYSIRRAHEYYLSALTAQSPFSRNRNFGLAFQTLGHVIHHVQDMAQFEHVRNDQHISSYDTSYYESWTQGRGTALPIANYPAVDLKGFKTSRSFWANDGKGIAEFTSRNFVSKDTNFIGGPGSFRVNAEYPLPAITQNPTVEKVSLATLFGSSWNFLPDAQVWFLGLPVTDVNQPSKSRFNARASSYSIFNQDLTLRLLPITAALASTTLNRFNFAAAHEFLMPRAVAYSAGLIDYFFRGRLALDSFDVAGTSVTLKVRNVSAADFALRERTDGEIAEFSLYYDAQDGTRRRWPLAGDDLVGQTMPVGATRTLSFYFPSDVTRDAEKPFMLVFDGVIGEESGVAALAIGAPVSGGLLVKPSYVPNDAVSGSRVISYGSNGWQLSDQAGWVAGNVDWRGHGMGDVLTWDGPPSRYFYPEGKRGGYSSAIYYQGRRLAVAPANVQGVSISLENDVKRLTVVTYQAAQLRVYTRPLRDVYANDGLYNAQSNSDGWRQIYSASELEPYTPTFFNASGNEAQLITASGASIAERVRLRFSGDLVTREAVSAVGAGRVETRNRRTVTPSERRLNAGQQEPSPNGPQACVYTNVCTDKQPCSGVFGGEVCLLSQLDYVSENTIAVQELSAYVFDRPTTPCVDYKGDAEVLCRIGYRHDAQTFLTANETDRFESNSQSTMTCPVTPPRSQLQDKESYRISSTSLLSNTLRVLKIGTIEVPLTGRSRESATELQHVRTVSGTETAVGANVYSGANTQTDFDWGVQSQLLYLDARNDIAVYETDETKITTVNAWNISSSGGWLPAGPSTMHTITNRELIATLGGERHSLWQNTSTEDATYPLGVIGGIGVYGVGRPGCTPIHIDKREEYDTAFTDIANWNAILHPQANNASQGYGVDREGRLAVSQTVWVRQTNGSYLGQGVWNYLSGGNLASVIPAAPTNASFYPIGVID